MKKKIQRPATKNEYHFKKLGEVNAARAITAKIDEILFEIEVELTDSAHAIPKERNRAFYFESGKTAGFAEAFKRLSDLRGLVAREYGGFVVERSKK